MRKVGMIASIAATLALLITLVASYTQHSSIIHRSILAHQAVDRALTTEDFATEERLSKAPTTGPLDQLRQIFEELHARQGTVGAFIMGQENSIYDARIRPKYVELVTATFVKPVQDRLLESMEKAIKTDGRDKDPAKLYDMEGGILAWGREVDDRIPKY